MSLPLLALLLVSLGQSKPKHFLIHTGGANFSQDPEIKPSNKVGCPPNETFSQCSAHCFNDDTCQSTEDICTRQCESGCVCVRGYIREYIGGPCIKKEDCPPGKQTEHLLIHKR